MTIERNITDADEFEDENLNTGSDKVFQNYMMPGLELYDAKVTINHWQLRDCIKPSSKNQKKLYYIYDHSIRILNTDSNALRKPPGYKSNILKYSKINSHINSSSSSKSAVRTRYNVPTEKLVEFNFKPRCFTEASGLTACGGLVGSDDKGFPTNWNRLHQQLNDTSPVPPPAKPINMSSRTVLDGSNYSNPNIWKGILSLYNEDTHQSSTVILGQFINNCVTLHKRSTSDYGVYACNNDGHVYECNVSNRDVELVRRYSDLKFPLNNAVLSHDGKTMVISGDSNKFAIYRQNEIQNAFTLNYDNQSCWGSTGNHNFRKITQCPRYDLGDNSSVVENIYTATNGDHGFYNCFSENDLQFATLFQNGICLIYDIRNTNLPLAEISSTRPHSHNGSFRVCRFSYGLDDLLFISEHQGRVHVVDTRNFVNHQVIMVPDTVEMEKPKQGDIVDPSLNLFSTNNIRRNVNHRMESHSPVLSRDDSTSSNPMLSNYTRRRFSMPSSFEISDLDPHVTSAMTIPLQYLEPKILPYPKVIDQKQVSHFSSNNLLGSMSDIDQITQNSSKVPVENRSAFRIRRISTASAEYIANCTGCSSTSLLGESNEIDGDLMDEGSLRVNLNPERDNMVEENTLLESISQGHGDNTTYPVGGRFERTSLDFDYPSPDVTDENNISGIDWIEDSNGSSLIIGTDYGIMKWNINSWARRSFSSYDFC